MPYMTERAGIHFTVLHIPVLHFYPRDAILAWVPAMALHLSVCLSLTRSSIETVE